MRVNQQYIDKISFCNLSFTLCSREKRYHALPAFLYCKWQKLGGDLGTRLVRWNFCCRPP